MKNIIVGVIIAIMMCFVGCSDNTVHTMIAGNMDEDTTLNLEGSPYIITETIILHSDATLTIEPGVKIIGGMDSDLSNELIGAVEVYGTINAVGTEELPIKVTNIYFDGMDDCTFVLEYVEMTLGGIFIWGNGGGAEFINVSNSVLTEVVELTFALGVR